MSLKERSKSRARAAAARHSRHLTADGDGRLADGSRGGGHGAQSPAPTRSPGTDASGRFELTGLYGGRLTITCAGRASAPPRRTANTLGPGTRSSTTAARPKPLRNRGRAEALRRGSSRRRCRQQNLRAWRSAERPVKAIQNLPGIAARPLANRSSVWGSAPQEHAACTPTIPRVSLRQPALDYQRRVRGRGGFPPQAYGADYGHAGSGGCRHHYARPQSDHWHGAVTLVIDGSVTVQGARHQPCMCRRGRSCRGCRRSCRFSIKARRSCRRFTGTIGSALFKARRAMTWAV